MKYNKALVCPENNSYGYATILKLQELKYPRLYYRRRKGVYVGGYVPQQTPDVAGFNTNGKTRGTVLAKLEEVLRNKQLAVYSSRFYEELKVFAVGTDGRAAARRGYNDDLVMSLAIGTWLFDASADYSKNSKALNDAMLAAMSRQTNPYSETPDVVNTPVIIHGGKNKQNRDSRAKFNGGANAKERQNINDHYWLF